MVSLLRETRRNLAEDVTIECEYRGLSTDTKPLLPANRNGSTFYEMDTQDAYMYNGESLKWELQ